MFVFVMITHPFPHIPRSQASGEDISVATEAAALIATMSRGRVDGGRGRSRTLCDASFPQQLQRNGSRISLARSRSVVAPKGGGGSAKVAPS